MKKKICLLLVIMVTLTVTVTFSACGSSDPKEAVVAVMANPAAAPLGDWVWNSAKLSADEWNADTTHKVKIKLEKVEYSTDPDSEKSKQLQIQAFEKLIADKKPVAIVGSLFSSEVLALNDSIKNANIPYLTAGTNAKLTSNGNSNIFRILPSDEVISEVAAKYLVSTLGKKKIATLYADTLFAKDGAMIFEDAAKKLGATIVLSKAHAYDAATAKDIDVSKEVSEINKTNADFLLAWPDTNAQLGYLKAFESQKLKMPFMGNMGFQDIAGDKPFTAISEGSLIASQFFPLSANKDWAAQIEALSGKGSVNSISACYYDSSKLLGTAFEGISGSITPEKVAEALKAVSYSGIMGDYKFDEKGDSLKQAYITKIQGGTVVFVKVETK